MLEVLGYDFMRHALLAGLLASLALGVLGSLVVVNRIVFLSGGIAHTAYGGVGLAVFLGLPPLLGATGFALAAGLVTAGVSLRNKDRVDAVIGVIWALGMALGVVLLDLTPGYRADLMSYLFGSILAVPAIDLWLLAGLDLVVGVMVGLYHRQFLALSFDEEFARSRGVPVGRLYTLLVVLISLAVVLVVRVVGLILVIALLTIPAFIAERFARTLLGMMALSVVLCALFSLAGLALAFYLDLTSGASIILVAGAAFFAALALKRAAPAAGSDA